MPRKGEKWTPEQRAKILAAKGLAENEQGANQAQPANTPRIKPRVPLAAIPTKPKGSKWVMKAGNRWDDATESIDGENELQIASDLLPDGMTLQWVTTTVYGQEFPQRRAKFEKTGWTPVHQEDFEGVFDGMFMPKGAPGEITKDGLVLMAKPTEMVQKSQIRDKRRAHEQVRIKEQALHGGDLGPGVMGADHPSARRFNHVNRSIERIAVPTDDD